MTQQAFGLALGDDEPVTRNGEPGVDRDLREARVIEEDDRVPRVERQEIDVVEERRHCAASTFSTGTYSALWATATPS